MHNNYYFLRQVARALSQSLDKAVVSECYSQSKAELIIRFETPEESFYIRASALPALSCISFPHHFQRARKNSVDLFPEIIGRHVTGVRQFENERSFLIQLKDGYSILFKMHGNRSNVIVLLDEQPLHLFRSGLEGDQAIDLETLDRAIDWSLDAYEQHRDRPQNLYFTFGKSVWEYLESKGLRALGPQEQWKMLQAFIADIEDPSAYFISNVNGTIRLLLFPYGEIISRVTDPIKASNEFYFTFVQHDALQREKGALMAALRSRLQSATNFVEKSQSKLQELQEGSVFRQWGDLLMANLHIIPDGASTIALPDFYQEGKVVEIKLKPTLSPQKNAEAYYRKSKNQQIEIDRLTAAIQAKTNENATLQERLKEIEAMDDLKAIRKIAEQYPRHEASADSESLPYYEFEHNGYRIWVGKNAAANDLLTFRHGYKEDLWLHAKDVAGSHVLIKHMAGKKFPKDVIERAAELAAYNSRRKTDSLCPVIVTPRKFVRKRKGDPAGAVVVEREDVIMVVPKLR